MPCNYKTLVTCKVCAFRRTLRINIKIPRYWVKQYRKDIEGFKEHYWEIGLPYKKECKRKNIRKILNKYFEIEREFNPIENTYHIFYILKPKNK